MGFELVLLTAFAAMICWGIGDFLIQRTVRKVGDLEALAFIGLFGGIILFPFVLSEINLLFSLENFLVLLLLAVITFVGAIFAFEAYKKGKISVIEVIIELELPVTISLGFIFFKEVLTLWQILLIIPIFVGIILMAVGAASKKPHNPFARIEKGVLLALLAAVGMGLINSFTALSTRQVSPMLAIWFPFLASAIMCFYVLHKQGKLRDTFTNFSKFKWLIIGMSLFDTLAWLLYAIALNTYNVGVITAITESYPIIALILGITINKEKVTRHQLIGAALAIIASILLAMTLL
ncbi:MAG: DMT family transporter [archaeon]|jgi:drug/metabolite transporter (DMT)-like permease